MSRGEDVLYDSEHGKPKEGAPTHYPSRITIRWNCEVATLRPNSTFDLAGGTKLEIISSISSNLVNAPFPLRHGDHLGADMIRSIRI